MRITSPNIVRVIKSRWAGCVVEGRTINAHTMLSGKGVLLEGSDLCKSRWQGNIKMGGMETVLKREPSFTGSGSCPTVISDVVNTETYVLLQRVSLLSIPCLQKSSLI